MLGVLLGYQDSDKTGNISGEDNSRYQFSYQDWKEGEQPKKGMKVDFRVDENGAAKDIYIVQNQAAENTDLMLGLISIGITFFFGFIGTFISRLLIAKQSFANTIIPTAIHFIITLLLFIPFLGWLIYLVGSFYYMYTNYKICTNK